MRFIDFACVVMLMTTVSCSYSTYNLNWVLLKKNACFQARDNQPAVIPVNKSGWLVAAKLVHVSGILKCYPPLSGSKFGCSDDILFNTYVCDDKRQIIFPSPNQKITYDTYKNFQYRGYSPNDNEVVFTDLSYPVYLNAGKQITIWNGEDLADKTEEDNFGIVCVDVYGSFFGSLN
ncbi:uncharacterized protein LOC100199100 [Hydra vulgaris]|uniref:uncharacterized protein LOC100199100 n=1 Tax=Hydra vulgaris TaxID=6087 RepID=UPI0001927643|nr:uncharacterized protein LOC100199100 [Hydra vulgaris]